MKVLITGAAGFIGNDLARRLLDRGDEVIGIDNLNDYYDPSLKRARLARIQDHPAFTDVRIDLEDRQGIADLFASHKPEGVVNLVAGITMSSIWCMRPAVRFTARIPKCRFPCTTTSITR